MGEVGGEDGVDDEAVWKESEEEEGEEEGGEAVGGREEGERELGMQCIPNLGDSRQPWRDQNTGGAPSHRSKCTGRRPVYVCKGDGIWGKGRRGGQGWGTGPIGAEEAPGRKW